MGLAALLLKYSKGTRAVKRFGMLLGCIKLLTTTGPTKPQGHVKCENPNPEYRDLRDMGRGGRLVLFYRQF